MLVTDIQFLPQISPHLPPIFQILLNPIFSKSQPQQLIIIDILFPVDKFIKLYNNYQFRINGLFYFFLVFIMLLSMTIFYFSSKRQYKHPTKSKNHKNQHQSIKIKTIINQISKLPKTAHLLQITTPTQIPSYKELNHQNSQPNQHILLAYRSPSLIDCQPVTNILLFHDAQQNIINFTNDIIIILQPTSPLFQLPHSFTMQHYKIQIQSHETLQNNKIVYVVQIKDEKNNKQKQTKLRYSQFKKIHQQIVQLINKYKFNIVLPDFPSRKVFGSTNKSQQSIMQRKKQLNTVHSIIIQYLNDLLTTDKLSTLDIVKKYYIPDQATQDKNKNQQLKMQVCIDRYTLFDDAVYYSVRFRDLNHHEQWTIKQRYRELYSIHQSLLDSKIQNLPKFPKKKIFGITNESPDDIERRRQELQKYFNEIFSIKEILNTEIIKFFIQETKKKAQREKSLQEERKKKIKNE